MNYTVVRTDELNHHGILGQRWGVRRFQNKDGSLKAAGKKRYSEDNGNKEHKGLTDKQKKAIKIGAIAAGTALAAVGTYYLYKNGNLDPIIDKFAKNGENASKLLAGEAFDGIKKLNKPETIEQALQNTNTLSKVDGKNTCVPSCVIGYARTKFGLDLSVKSTNGQMQNLGGVVEECFSGAKVLDGSAQKFGRSREDAVEMIRSRFGDNCDGCIAVNLKQLDGTTNGHAFNFKVTNGNCEFMDFRHHLGDKETSQYFNRIDVNGSLQLVDLTNAIPKEEGLKKWSN